MIKIIKKTIIKYSIIIMVMIVPFYVNAYNIGFSMQNPAASFLSDIYCKTLGSLINDISCKTQETTPVIPIAPVIPVYKPTIKPTAPVQIPVPVSTQSQSTKIIERTIVEKNIFTNSPIDTSNFVTKDFFTRQIDAVFNSVGKSISNISTVTSTGIPNVSGSAYGDLLYWTGSVWNAIATSSLGISGVSSQWTTSGSTINYPTGNVGIATTSPYAKLSVTGDTAFDGNMLVTGTTTANGFVLNANKTFYVGNEVLVDSNGNINATVLPQQDTAVNLSSTVPASGESVYETDTKYMKVGDGVTSVGNLSPLNPWLGNLSTSTFAGAIGIGTTTPYGLLNIAGVTPRLTLSDTSAGANLKHWYIQSSGGSLNFATSSDGLVDNSFFPALRLNAQNMASLMTVEGIYGASIGGDLLLGATQFAYQGANNRKISVQNLLGSDGGSLSLSAANGSIFFNGNFAGGALNLIAGNADADTSATGGAINITAGNSVGMIGPNVVINGGNGTTRGNVLIATSSGNVGIGTTSPYAKLSVAGQVVAQYYTATGTATSTFAGGIQANIFNATSATASSTFANGINLNAGCFAVNNTCITNSTYSDSNVNSYISASSTIPKTYTANTFSALQTLTAGLTTNALTVGSLTGPLQSINGVVSASSTLSVAYGGTGQNSFGQGWLNSNGTTITSSTSPTVNYITATSTTATSTFAGGATFATGGGKVGIGTTTPYGLLNIAGVTPRLTLSDTSAGANLKHWYMQSSGGSLNFGTSSDGLVDNSAGGTFVLNTTITDASRVAANVRGDLGINGDIVLDCCAPVFGNPTVGSRTIRAGGVSASGWGAGNSLSILAASAVDSLGFFDYAGGALNLIAGNAVAQTSATGGAINITAGNSVGMIGPNVVINGGNGTTRGNVLIATSSGNLGIGTTSPYAKLSIQKGYGNTNTTLFSIASSTSSTGSTANTLFDISNTGVFTSSTTVSSAATSTIKGNLYVNGTLRSTLSYVGDLFFANNFSFAEAPLDGATQGLLLRNQRGQDALTIDENGNMSLIGDVCYKGKQCFGKSINELESNMNALASTTSNSLFSAQATTTASLSELTASLGNVNQALALLGYRFDTLSSTTIQALDIRLSELTASTTFLNIVASSTANLLASSTADTLAGSTPFLEKIFISFMDFLTSATAHILNIFVGDLHIENKLCVDDVCINKDQLKALLISASSTTPQAILSDVMPARSTSRVMRATVTIPEVSTTIATTTESVTSTTTPLVLTPDPTIVETATTTITTSTITSNTPSTTPAIVEPEPVTLAPEVLDTASSTPN